MKDKLSSYVASVNKLNKKKKRWKQVVSILVTIVVFCTTYALILPAITMEKQTICGLEEHSHVSACYSLQPALSCKAEDYVHTHNEECYDENKNLICEEIDYVFHSHADECCSVDGKLICKFPEVVEHKHTDKCYQVSEKVVQEGYKHSEECYDGETLICQKQEQEEITEQTEKKLVCELKEIIKHEHSDECYEEEENGEKALICSEIAVEAHIHNEACYGEKAKTLECELPEHTHIDSCYLKCPECGEIEEHKVDCPHFEFKCNCGSENDDHKKSCPLYVSLMSIDSNEGVIVDDDTTIDNSNISLDKNVSDITDDDGNHTLTLETFATGKTVVSQTFSEKPADIVLVLDYSNSMAYCSDPECTRDFSSYSLTEDENFNLPHAARLNGTSDDQFTAHYYDNTVHSTLPYYVTPNTEGGSMDPSVTQEYYAAVKDHGYRSYKKVYYCQECSEQALAENGYNAEDYRYHFAENREDHALTIGPAQAKDKDSGAASDGVLWYSFFTTEIKSLACITRYRMMYESLNYFLNDLEMRSKGADKIAGTEDDVDHKISFVRFSVTSNLLLAMTPVLGEDGEISDSILEARDNVKFVSGTATDAGLQTGVDQLAKCTISDERNRLLILLTDGVPTGTTSGGTTGRVGPSLKQTYNAINKYQADVYTIGIFEGADASNKGTIVDLNVNNFHSDLSTQAQRDTINSFMNLLSSNYPNISTINQWSNRNETALTLNPALASDQSYYIAAGDIDELRDAFTQISKGMTTETTAIALDKTTVIKDVITRYFDVTQGSEIVAYTMTYLGDSDTGEKLWQKDENSVSSLTVAEGQTSVGELSIEMEVNGNATTSVFVSNFDFGENYVGIDEHTVNGQTTYTPRGKKVVIEIKIKRKSEFIGGNEVPTNTVESGVYKENEETIDTFPVPDTDLTITPQIVVAPPLHFYLGDTFLEHVTVADMQDYMEVYINDVKLDLTDTDNYGFDWENDYVDIDVIFLDESDNEMPNGFVDLKQDQVYKVKVVVNPLYDGAEQTVITSNEGIIKVYHPELKFKDSWYYFGETIPNSNFLEDNALIEDETRWRDADGVYSDSEGIVMNSQTVPEIVLTCIPDYEGTTMPNVDVPVEVTINSVGYVENPQAMSYFDWEECFPNCDQNIEAHPANQLTPEFYLHARADIALPNTGGIGTHWYIFSGFALVFGALTLLYRKKRNLQRGRSD